MDKPTIKVGDLITDKVAGCLLVVVGERSSSKNDSIFGNKEYEVYWSQSATKSWVSEVVLLLIKTNGIRTAIKLVGNLFEKELDTE